MKIKLIFFFSIINHIKLKNLYFNKNFIKKEKVIIKMPLTFNNIYIFINIY